MENAGIGVHVKDGLVHLVLFAQDADLGFTPEQAQQLGELLVEAGVIAQDGADDQG